MAPGRGGGARGEAAAGPKLPPPASSAPEPRAGRAVRGGASLSSAGSPAGVPPPPCPEVALPRRLRAAFAPRRPGSPARPSSPAPPRVRPQLCAARPPALPPWLCGAERLSAAAALALGRGKFSICSSYVFIVFTLHRVVQPASSLHPGGGGTSRTAQTPPHEPAGGCRRLVLAGTWVFATARALVSAHRIGRHGSGLKPLLVHMLHASRASGRPPLSVQYPLWSSASSFRCAHFHRRSDMHQQVRIVIKSLETSFAAAQ